MRWHVLAKCSFLTLLSSLGLGCDMVHVTTTGAAPVNVRSARGRAGSPASGGGGGAAAAQASGDTGRDRHFQKAKAAYDAAAALAHQPTMDALALMDAEKGAVECLNESTDLNAPGDATFKALHASCETLLADLEKRAVPGCGVQRVDLESLSLGGGKWTPARLASDRDYYAPDDCKGMPKASLVPREFKGLETKVGEFCRKAPKVIFEVDEWSHHPMPGGQVRRTAVASCWVQGTFNDWGKAKQ